MIHLGLKQNSERVKEPSVECLVQVNWIAFQLTGGQQTQRKNVIPAWIGFGWFAGVLFSPGITAVIPAPKIGNLQELGSIIRIRIAQHHKTSMDPTRAASCFCEYNRIDLSIAHQLQN